MLDEQGKMVYQVGANSVGLCSYGIRSSLQWLLCAQASLLFSTNFLRIKWNHMSPTERHWTY